MDYFKKYEENPAEDLRWNIPEQKQGMMALIGGNGQNFRSVVKTAEWLSNYSLKDTNIVLPDVLKGKLPPVPGLVFLKSTETGSFADEKELLQALNAADYNLLIGDLSKNAVTARAVGSACASSEKPLLITRDAIDLVAENQPERTLMNEQLVLMASVAQLQKLLRAVYYPKMLMMSQSLIQVAEVLHKFTLSYPVAIVSLHNGQILVAQSGNVAAVPLEKTGHSPITLWQGDLAAKIAVYNLFNPNNFINATVCALF